MGVWRGALMPAAAPLAVAPVGITRIGPQVRRAQRRLGVDLSLETAGVRTGAAAPGPPAAPDRRGG